MPGYWVIRDSGIKDTAAFDEYSRRWGPIAEKYDARFIAGGEDSVVCEGNDWERHLIVEFPSYKQALDCYNSPEYQAGLPFAQKALDREFSIVEGVGFNE